jgi:hypothetical protein
MTILQNSPPKDHSAPRDEMYCDHFKNIYSIEEIDVTKVKPLSPSDTTTTTAKTFSIDTASVPYDDEGYCLDFGYPYRSWIESIPLHEPIHVLELSTQPHDILLAEGLTTLLDLIHTPSLDLVHLKGMGQGYIDEIHTKLAAYLSTMTSWHTTTIDIISMMRCLVGDIAKTEIHPLLEKYHLAEIITLSQAEKASLHNEKEKTNPADVLSLLRAPHRITRIHTLLRDITHAFIIPWMYTYHGIASRSEVFHRFRSMTSQPSKAKYVLNFIQEIYYNGALPFAENLIEVEKDTYCATDQVNERYLSILNTAKTYFYSRHLVYSLEELCYYIAREHVQRWDDVTYDLIARVLRRSPLFRVRKGDDGNLYVRPL